MVHRLVGILLAAVLAASLPVSAQDAPASGDAKPSCGSCQDAPKADTPAPPEAKPEAKPEGAAPAAGTESAPEEKKRKAKGPLGLPDLRTLKEALELSKDQVKQVKELYASYEEKVKEAEAKANENADKRAARRELKPLRDEIAAKLREICTEEQKKKLDELLAPPKKKK